MPGQEAKLSHDVGEARLCLRALAVPFFHHELVKQALLAAMEEPAAAPTLLGLLKALADSADVSALQMQKARPCRLIGFTRRARAAAVCWTSATLHGAVIRGATAWSRPCGRPDHGTSHTGCNA